MSIKSLCALPVADLSAPQAHLYLWTTNSFMEEAYAVARAWGFKPKTVLTWVKTQKDSPATPSMKMGWYFRSATEHILFAVRGKSRTLGAPEPTAFLARREPHSVKPQMFFDLAQRQSPGPYLEMFARRERQGWSRWGTEVESTVRVDSSPEQPVEAQS
jgi:N6-adenosine-specific RNA methylase IME4